MENHEDDIDQPMGGMGDADFFDDLDDALDREQAMREEAHGHALQAQSSSSSSSSAEGHDEQRNAKRVKVELKDMTNIVDPSSIDYSVYRRPAVSPVFNASCQRAHRPGVPSGMRDEAVVVPGFEKSDPQGKGRISFMQVDLDDYNGKPNRKHGGTQNQNAEVPVLRMYGITSEGHSVLAHIHGFAPYFYCPVPADSECLRDSNFFLNKNNVLYLYYIKINFNLSN